MGEEVDILGSLAPFYPDGVSAGDTEKVKALHDVFHNDFFVNQVNIGGVPLKVKPYKYNRSKKDNLPIEYENFYEKFVHIITRTVKANNWKTAPNIREFREDRANRVHWIRPILENCDDNRITRFSYTEADGTQREYFWYRKKQYIVVVEEIDPNYTLITGFCVDAENQPHFQNKYINRD